LGIIPPTCPPSREMNQAIHLSCGGEETFREREEFTYFPLDVNKRVIRLTDLQPSDDFHIHDTKPNHALFRLMLYVSIRIVSMRNVRRLVT
jgi:hypothetical protein